MPNRLASPTYTRIIFVKLPMGVPLSTKALEVVVSNKGARVVMI